MLLFSNPAHRNLRQCIAVALTLTSLCGCTRSGGEKAVGKGGKRDGGDRPIDAELTSANYLLTPEDYDEFRPGRPKDEILKALQWWGNFEEATEYKGKSVSAISYGLFGGPFSDRGIAIWAIFVDDKFEKFVRWPEWDDGPLKIKIGDHRMLIRAVESEPVNIAALKKEMEASPAPPSETDPGLTAAWLLLRETVGKQIEQQTEKEYKKNAELRDRFNASRLKIGMTGREVETVLGEKPITSGQVEAGSYKIYGSTEYVGVDSYLHYSNILVVFQQGRLSGIYSGALVPGGKEGLRQMREWFTDLPPLQREPLD